MTGSDLAQSIRELLPMREAAKYYGFEVNRAGFISCPFHKEKTASCKIYENSFHCFGCGEGGDVITFVMNLYRLDFKAAVIRINIDFGLGLSVGSEQSEQDRERIRQANARRKQQEEEKRRINDKRRRYTDMRCELWQQKKKRPLTENEANKLKVLDDWLDANPAR